MINRPVILLTILIFFHLLSYSQNTKVTLNSVDMILPGPGQWRGVAKNEAGGQWMFKNDNSGMTVSLSARQKTKFDFYKDTLSDFNLVIAFFKWDADYWASDPKNAVTQIKTNKDKNYLVWRLKTQQGANLLLSGLKADHFIGIQIPDDGLLSDDMKIKYLETIYLN